MNDGNFPPRQRVTNRQLIVGPLKRGVVLDWATILPKTEEQNCGRLPDFAREYNQPCGHKQGMTCITFSTSFIA
jgi:hypothetical protein